MHVIIGKSSKNTYKSFFKQRHVRSVPCLFACLTKASTISGKQYRHNGFARLALLRLNPPFEISPIEILTFNQNNGAP